MPRLLISFHKLTLTNEATRTGGLQGAATFLLLCALTLMTCVSHARWRRWRSRRSSDDDGPIISIHQVQPGAGLITDACVWQKSILMGGKCQLPDFSGVISATTLTGTSLLLADLASLFC